MLGKQENSNKNIKETLIFLSLFFVSSSLFMYEVLLTRLYSVILGYNMVFLVISFAILGSGIGGIFAYRGQKKTKNNRKDKSKGKKNINNKKTRDNFNIIFMIIPFSIIFSISIMYFLPFMNFYLIYALIGTIPNVFGGYVISLIFKQKSKYNSILYFIDLIGSAIGSLLIIKFMNSFGFMISIIISSSIALLGALLINLYYSKKRELIFLGIVQSILIIGLIQGTLVKKIEMKFNAYYSDPIKALQYLNGTDTRPLGISFSRWNAISKTDVLETTDKNQKMIITDGGAEAPIIKFDGNLKSVEYLKQDLRQIPFTFGNNESTLIIGSGGGKDVLHALLGGSRKIDAVEINPATIEAVNHFKDYDGNIYNYPGVRVYNEDGRAFVDNSNEKYDNILLAMVMTNSVENTMYSMSENYVFTYEAFQQYFKHLSSNGKLSFMMHDTLDMAKIVNTGIKVLMDEGVKQQDVTKYYVIVNGMSKEETAMHGSSIDMPLVIFKNVPFTDSEINAIKNSANERDLPIIQVSGQEFDVYKLLKDKKISYGEMIKEIPFNSSPTTDNKPFIHNYSKPAPLSTLIALLIIIPVWIFIRIKYLKDKTYKKISWYFIGLGVAYMFVELSAIQKMILYYGTPSLAFSVVLFSLLISSGIGSFISGLKVVRKINIKSPYYLLLTSLSIILVETSITKIMSVSNVLPVSLKILVGFISIFPMGLLMGIPFPTGIEKIRQIKSGEEMIPLMWGVNGLFSVAGSVLAVFLSMVWGFNLTMLLSAAIYLVLFFINPFNKTGLSFK